MGWKKSFVFQILRVISWAWPWKWRWEFNWVQTMRGIENWWCSPLQYLQKMCFQNGSPLSMDRQLCRLSHYQTFSPFSFLCHMSLHIFSFYNLQTGIFTKIAPYFDYITDSNQLRVENGINQILFEWEGEVRIWWLLRLRV